MQAEIPPGGGGGAIWAFWAHRPRGLGAGIPYILEVRPGSLRLISPTWGAYLAYLLMMLSFVATAIGYLSLVLFRPQTSFDLVAMAISLPGYLLIIASGLVLVLRVPRFLAGHPYRSIDLQLREVNRVRRQRTNLLVAAGGEEFPIAVSMSAKLEAALQASGLTSRMTGNKG